MLAALLGVSVLLGGCKTNEAESEDVKEAAGETEAGGGERIR